MAKKYDVEKWALDNGASPHAARMLAASDPDHERGKSKDHLADHERAHSGKPGAKVRHGADATKRVPYGVDKKMRPIDTEQKGWPPGTSKWSE